MNPLLVVVVIFLALLLQTTLFSYLIIGGAKPNLVLILVVYLALEKGARAGHVIGFLSGLFEDIISTSVLGPNALVKTIVGYLTGSSKGKLSFTGFSLRLHCCLWLP